MSNGVLGDALLPPIAHCPLRPWSIVTTPLLSGSENMRYDAELLLGVEQGTQAPTLRFFRFQEPTVSYGRLQNYEQIKSLIPAGWTSVQRPTGGGIVFHQNDLCLSLCWPNGLAPLPERSREQYRWIHAIALEVLTNELPVRMAACCDAVTSQEPFATRTCFQNAVGYDLLVDQRKVAGGALRCTRQATLYQGSLQMTVSSELEVRLLSAFKARLARTS